MILPKLFALKKLVDEREFYELQAEDSIRWLKEHGVTAKSHPTALDLSCGQGHFGHLLIKHGYQVSYADFRPEDDMMHPCIPKPRTFYHCDLHQDDLTGLGKYDLVIFSNTLEHIKNPHEVIHNIMGILKPGGKLYLTWTNWLSLYGGHEYSPYHYLGVKAANWLRAHFFNIDPGNNPHRIGENLFPTYIGRTVRYIKRHPRMKIEAMTPRYYSELKWIAYIPVVREFLSWNFAMLIGQRPK